MPALARRSDHLTSVSIPSKASRAALWKLRWTRDIGRHIVIFGTPGLVRWRRIRLHARVDVQVKQRAAKVLRDLGLSVSDAIRLLLVRVAGENTLSFFEIEMPNAETRAAMGELEQGMRRIERAAAFRQDFCGSNKGRLATLLADRI